MSSEICTLEGTICRTVHEYVPVLPLTFKLGFQMAYIKHKMVEAKIYIKIRLHLTPMKPLNALLSFAKLN